MDFKKLTEEEVLDKVIDLIEQYPSVNEPETYVLKYNGKILRLLSGKSSWKKKHHAINAFTNSIYGWFYHYRHGWTPSDVTKLLIEKGILQVVKIN